MLRGLWTVVISGVLALGATACDDEPARRGSGAGGPAPAAAVKVTNTSGPVDFVADVKPILAASCVRCHKASGGPGSPLAVAAGGPVETPQGGPPEVPPGAPQGGPPGGPPGGFARGPGGGLRLDDGAAAMKGGKHGLAIVPGKPDDSLLIQTLKGAVPHGDDEIPAMPKPRPGGKYEPLPDDQIDVLKRWIEQGAEWPADAPAE